MKINKVTITGADNKVKGEDLLKLQEQYPFVEWGVLFSLSKEGHQRFPSLLHIEQELNSPLLNLSAHFCGHYSKEVLENQNTLHIEALGNFKRIQLNYVFRKGANYDLLALRDYLKKTDKQIILQYNKSNQEVLEHFLKWLPDQKLNLLFDSSGGRGTAIKLIERPFDHYTGYSGGINPDNIENVIKLIRNHKRIDEVWIDMESGVRTDNEFDLDKVKDVLEKCKQLI